jgi:hypothetical protein
LLKLLLVLKPLLLLLYTKLLDSFTWMSATFGLFSKQKFWSVLFVVVFWIYYIQLPIERHSHILWRILNGSVIGTACYCCWC